MIDSRNNALVNMNEKNIKKKLCLSRESNPGRLHGRRELNQLSYWGLLIKNMTYVWSCGHRKKKCIPMPEKWMLLGRITLRHTFHSLRELSFPRSGLSNLASLGWTTVRSRKVKFSRGMKSMPSSFSPSEHSLSRHREHIFLVISRNKSGTICRKQFPWHVRHIPVWKRSISKWGIFKSLIP